MLCIVSLFAYFVCLLVYYKRYIKRFLFCLFERFSFLVFRHNVYDESYQRKNNINSLESHSYLPLWEFKVTLLKLQNGLDD